MNKKQNFENASTEALFRQFLCGWIEIEYEYSPPSALRKEENYAKHGIKLPFKLHYEYKVPAVLESQYGLLFWLRGAFKKMQPFEELWTSIQNVEIDKLSDAYVKKQISYYRTFSKERFAKIYMGMQKMQAAWPVDKMVAEIKRLNPELAHIKTDGKHSNVMGSAVLVDFFNGVAYGFAPEDIDFCLNAPRDEFLKINDKIDKLGLSHGHIPAPSRLDALIAADAEVNQVMAQRVQEKGHE